MNTIDVLIVVDVISALSSGSLSSNTYLVDSNHFIGSWAEGTSSLTTVCQDGQLVRWAPTSLSATADIRLHGFGGPMVYQGICVPTSQGATGSDSPWEGQIQARGSVGSYPYTVTVAFEGTDLSFPATLKVA